MNGLELCNNLRKKANPPYILMASGSRCDQVIQECKEAGANDYLCKPFNLDMLQSRLLDAARFLESSADSENHASEPQGGVPTGDGALRQDRMIRVKSLQNHSDSGPLWPSCVPTS